MGYGYAGLGGAPGDWRSQLPDKYQGRRAVGYCYAVDWTPLPASSSQNGGITINTDDFVVLAAVAVVTLVNNLTRLTFVPQIVQISDTGSSATWFSAPTHFHNIFGTAEDPCFWEQPRVVEAGATITIALQNLEATDRNVRLVLRGAKLIDG